MNPALLWIYSCCLCSEFFLTIQAFQRFLLSMNSQKHLIQFFHELSNLSFSALYEVVPSNEILGTWLGSLDLLWIC